MRCVGGGVDPRHLAGAGPLVPVRLFVLPAGIEPASVLPTATPGLELLTRTLLIDGLPHLLVAGRPEALQTLAQRVSLLKGSAHEVPHWLQVLQAWRWLVLQRQPCLPPLRQSRQKMIWAM
jgi:hypothetical protein